MATRHYRFVEQISPESRIDRIEVSPTKTLELHRPGEGRFVDPISLTDAEADRARSVGIIQEVDLDAPEEQADYAPTQEEYDAALKEAKADGRLEEEKSSTSSSSGSGSSGEGSSSGGQRAASRGSQGGADS